VKEALWLYPTTPLTVPHHSIKVVTVGGYYIPKKTMSLLNLWAIGRDPTIWGKDDLEFNPERFMQEEFIDL